MAHPCGTPYDAPAWAVAPYKSRFIGANITNLQQIVSIIELYRRLLWDNAPVRDGHRPFFTGVAIRQVDKLGQGCVIRENTLVLCDLADLAMVALHRIGRINELPDGLGILKELAQAAPVVTPWLVSVPWRCWNLLHFSSLLCITKIKLYSCLTQFILHSL